MESEKSQKSVRLLNLGCSKNQVDSENILGDFVSSGYVATNKKEADVVVINTCGFIGPAKEESINEILEAVSERTEGQKIIVSGCLSQRYKEDLKKEIPEVDFFYGTYKSGEIAKDHVLELKDKNECQVGPLSRIFLEEKPHHAYLKIAEGCNRVCGFCAIPGMRGKQDSRGIADIVQEAKELQKKGIVEISLIAQDLTFFGREKKSEENLELLLRELVAQTDIPWIRLMYGYPAYLDSGLLDYISKEPRICNYLDMPIQHSSSTLLKTMKRGYTGEILEKIVKSIRTTNPELTLRTTVLVGYPGETEADFQHLLKFIQENPFERLGGFAYSEEEGTYAGDELKKENIEESVIQERLSQLMAVQQEISYDLNQRQIGKELKVIIDSYAEEDSEYSYIGRTEGDAPEIDNTVFIKGNEAVIGTFRTVKIENAWEFDLEGTLLPE